MKTQFETEEEAQKALNNAREESLGWCPVIKESCHHGQSFIESCVSYYAGDIHHKESQRPPTKEYWFVHYPGCTNVLVNGEINAHCEY